MLPDASLIAVSIAAITINGLGKGGLGSAVGMIGVPLMSLVMPPLKAAAILLPLLVMMDCHAMWNWRRHINWQVVRIILPPGLCGILLGALIFRNLPDESIKLLIGLIAVMFSLQHWLSIFTKKKQRKPGSYSGVFWAVFSGFTSFGIHAGGPVISIYLLPLHLDKKVLAGTSAIFFGILNITKLFAYQKLGQFSADNLMLTLILIPFCPLSVLIGIKLLHILPQKIFYQVLYVSLLVTGLKLIFDATFGATA